MAPSSSLSPGSFPRAVVSSPWPAPNYIDPSTRDWAAPACLIALFVFSSGVFLARIWARFRITKTAGLDDWLIIVSMPMLLGQVITAVLALRVYGLQLHIYDQTPRTTITSRQITLAFKIIYLGPTSLTKVSILVFYRRMSSAIVNKPFLIAVWATIFFVIASGISFTFYLIFTCSPVEASWLKFTPAWTQHHSYRCLNELDQLIIIVAVTTTQDFVVFILPMFMLYKVRLTCRQKIGLAVVFGTGAITCIIGFLRCHLAYEIYHAYHTHDTSYDDSWEAYRAWIATTAESCLGIVCASAPALKVYFRCLNRPEKNRRRSFHWDNDRRSSAASSTLGSLQSMFVGLATGRAFQKVSWWISMRRKSNRDDINTGHGQTTVKSEEPREPNMPSREFPSIYQPYGFPDVTADGIKGNNDPRLSHNENVACV